jgi:hypothetical protein
MSCKSGDPSFPPTSVSTSVGLRRWPLVASIDQRTMIQPIDRPSRMFETLQRFWVDASQNAMSDDGGVLCIEDLHNKYGSPTCSSKGGGGQEAAVAQLSRRKHAGCFTRHVLKLVTALHRSRLQFLSGQPSSVDTTAPAKQLLQVRQRVVSGVDEWSGRRCAVLISRLSFLSWLCILLRYFFSHLRRSFLPAWRAQQFSPDELEAYGRRTSSISFTEGLVCFVRRRAATARDAHAGDLKVPEDLAAPVTRSPPRLLDAILSRLNAAYVRGELSRPRCVAVAAEEHRRAEIAWDHATEVAWCGKS